MDAHASANEQIVRRIYDAFNARDIPVLASLFADDCETVDMGTRRTYRGFEGFMEWVKPFADAMPDSTASMSCRCIWIWKAAAWRSRTLLN